MALTYQKLMELAANRGEDATSEQEIINEFNDVQGKEGLKSLTMGQYLLVKATYFKTHYSGYTAAAAALLVSGLYLGALALSPAAIPFGLASLTGFLNYAVIGTALVTALGSLYILVPRTLAQIKSLRDRIADKEISKEDIALLASIALLGAAHAVALFAMPSLLPVVLGASLSFGPKAAVAAVSAGAAAWAGYSLFTGRGKGNAPAPARPDLKGQNPAENEEQGLGHTQHPMRHG